MACGGPVAGVGSLRDTYGTRPTIIAIALIAIVCLLAVAYSDVYVPAVADWYLEKAIPKGM